MRQLVGQALPFGLGLFDRLEIEVLARELHGVAVRAGRQVGSWAFERGGSGCGIDWKKRLLQENVDRPFFSFRVIEYSLSFSCLLQLKL